MARIVNLNLSGEPWSQLADDERLDIPILRREDFSSSMLVANRGFWGGEDKYQDQVYFVLKGHVAFEGEDDMALREGQAVVFKPGERHSMRVEDGCVLLHWDFDPPTD